MKRLRSYLAKPVVWSRGKLLVIYLSIFLAVALNIAWTTVQVNNFCDLMVTLDDAYHAAPLQSKVGQKVARDVSDLRHNLRC